MSWGNVRPQTKGHKLTGRHFSLSIITGWGRGWHSTRPNRRDCFYGRGASPKMPFRFRRTSWSLSERSVSSVHWQNCSINPKDRRHYCIWVRLILGDGAGNQPQPSHVWGGCLITDILQEAWPEDQITKAVVLSPGVAIFFFGRCSGMRGFPITGQEV